MAKMEDRRFTNTTHTQGAKHADGQTRDEANLRKH